MVYYFNSLLLFSRFIFFNLILLVVGLLTKSHSICFESILLSKQNKKNSNVIYSLLDKDSCLIKTFVRNQYEH